MLIVSDIHAYYGQSHVLQGVSLEVRAAEVVSILGRNGSGKTTTLLTIMGYLSPAPGRVHYQGRDISGWAPYHVSRLGLGFVPQERGIFSSLTVRENLTVSARRGRSGEWTLQRVFRLFPRLEESFRLQTLLLDLLGTRSNFLGCCASFGLNCLLGLPTELGSQLPKEWAFRRR